MPVNTPADCPHCGNDRPMVAQVAVLHVTYRVDVDDDRVTLSEPEISPTTRCVEKYMCSGCGADRTPYWPKDHYIEYEDL